MRALLFLFVFIISINGFGQSDRAFFGKLQKKYKPSKILIYKEVDGRKLELHVFNPEGFKSTDKRPVFVAIHGGGWVGGTPQRFYPYANWFVDKGFVGISVQYRLIKKGKSNVFDCVKDGREALRYIRANATKLGIDPQKIVVSGGSAGGHVASGTALFNFDHKDEDLKVSCEPNAMVLLFPVIDTSKQGYGNGKIGKEWKSLSPAHNVTDKTPPTLIFHGAKDNVTPLAGAKIYKKEMDAKGKKCELVIDPNGKHGHLNSNKKLFDDARTKTLEFLKKLKIYTE